MATAKKATSKKSPAKAKTTSKATSAKKAPAKKTPVKKSTATRKTTTKAPTKKTVSKKGHKYDSFKLASEKTPFFTFKVTDQTVYWLVLSVTVFILALWVLKLHLEVVRISAGI